MGIFNNRLFVRLLKYNNLSLVSRSQNNCFLDRDFHHSDIRFTFFLIFLMLLTLKRKTFKNTKYFSVSSFHAIAVNVSIATWVYNILISLSGDVQLNPGPKNKSDVNFSICHLNLNSIAAHNYAKVLLLQAYIAVYKFDIICISETYLDTSITSDDGISVYDGSSFNSFRKNSDNSELKRHLVSLQERVKGSTESSKQNYYYRIANKLNNTQKNPKSYWSLLKIVLNNKKIPLTPPLFHENHFIMDFKEMDFKENAELLNSFFSKPCSLITNNSKLPTSSSYLTDKSLPTITFSAEDIRKIIRSINPNKAHGHDNLNTRMLKLCGDAIYDPLEMTFNQALISGSFPSYWKKANIVPIHKKGNKQTLKNFRPVSLLPICSKIFERLIFNEMFRFFRHNKLTTTNQSGFKLGGSCINQLLSIAHEIYKSFDDGLEVRAVFLDISKAFDKV